ncbi:CvpA family protein [Gordoniibacillus kamchatkensis]|uniref:CvpA family protein n=1 Tax=Gordoniibacillus kamchatkensis TaxID=1590651 RepID=A0ABR5AA48_9BACL|nr:CvpA family protein [Paenibacillus sp. VKM B-2647]KIL37879.1 CvpA family protein [Paenibacillus sp. VKM B-2647]
MNGLDWVLLAVVLGGLVLGYSRGFIGQIVSFAGLFVAYIVAYKFYGDLAPIVKNTIALPSAQTYQKYEFFAKTLNLETYIVNAISFALLFFGVKLALVVAGHALNFIAKAPGLNLVNRSAGALLGLAEAALIVVVGVNVMTILPSDPIQSLLQHSMLAPYALDGFPAIAGKLRHLWETTSGGSIV